MEKEVFLRKYEEVYKDLYRYALFALGHPQDAEDAVSEAVMDAYKGKDGLKNPEAFRGWIFRILSRKCKAKRKEYATKKVLPLDASVEEGGSLEERQSFEDWNFGSSMEESERVLLRQMFLSLNEEERSIIGLHIFGGYTSKEIGKILGLLPATVRSKEHRGLEKLKKEITVYT